MNKKKYKSHQDREKLEIYSQKLNNSKIKNIVN